MKLDKTHLWIAIAFFAIGALCGFFSGKAVYSTTDSVKVERDTVFEQDTTTHINPSPVDGTDVRKEYHFLPMVRTERDTVLKTDTVKLHDSVLVEVPITSKHYQAKEYDAWVSGYNQALDSIKVYQEKQIITEKVTVTKTKRKPWGVGFHVGYGYDPVNKTASPFVGVGLSYDIISF